MAIALEPSEIASIAVMDEVRQVSQLAGQMIAMWPLTDPQQLENDAKYGENLQVRLTHTAARILTGLDVTIPDAEFVYEGADEIPGRPQDIVEALFIANEAYDQMANYSETGDTSLIMAGAGDLRVNWNDQTVHDVAEALVMIEQMNGQTSHSSQTSANTNDNALNGVQESAMGSLEERLKQSEQLSLPVASDIESIAQRLATVIASFIMLFNIIDSENKVQDEGDDTCAIRHRAVRMLPILLYINELCERLNLPRICMKDRQFIDILQCLRNGNGIMESQSKSFTTMLCLLIESEWKKHYDDVMWDPVAAKRIAKEEDERKSREALAAKFAHVKDDPTKEEVEL